MTLGAAHQQVGREDAVRLAVFLTRERGLAESDVLRALTLQHTEQLTFAQALIQLGLATPADINAALGETAPIRPAHVPPLGKAFTSLVGIRALRTEILLRQTGQGCNAFAVVSAAAGDGSARLASELAIAFAQLGEPTLLIDANLRRPEQQQLFGLRDRSGLADALASNAAIDYAGVDGLPELTVLTAGKRPSNPQELLSSSAFGGFVDDARLRFQHVVVDTPDASDCSDGLVVAAAVGAALPVARIDATPLPDYTELVRRLKTASVRIVGGVLNAATTAR
jgi:receptor protein-tyrosine kinase